MNHEHADDPHNHKHTGSPEMLNLSDRFFAPLDRQVVEWLEFAPDSKILDAGCGGGGMTRLLAEAVGPHGEVVGLDANPELLQWGQAQIKATKIAERITLQQGDISRLPFADGAFDLVWCSRVVHGLSDQLAGIRELARVVRPGGRLILREGGLPLQFLPFDTGLGNPGLHERLEVVRAQWFANWQRSLPNWIDYPYGWSRMLREAGLNAVTPKSFIYEFASPLEAYQSEYLASWLKAYLHNHDSKQLLSDQDIDTIEQLLDPNSHHYVFNRDDLYGVAVNTIYAGTK